MLFPFPGSIASLNASKLRFTPLVRTGFDTSTVAYSEMLEMSPMGPGGLNPDRRHIPSGLQFVLAARITGELPAEPAAPAAKKDAAPKSPATTPINVVVVADIDMLHDAFFRLRDQGEIPELGVHFKFDNVTFVLNVLDSLAGDNRFIEIRKRSPAHRILKRIDEVTKKLRDSTAENYENLQKEYEAAMADEDKKLQKEKAELQKQLEQENVNVTEIVNRVGIQQREGEQRRDAKAEQLQRKKKRDEADIERTRNSQIHAWQNWYKMWAVLLPPILPLAVGIVVFVTRRMREKEGVSRSRLKS
jgi:ABC-2 type transport system permease protein